MLVAVTAVSGCAKYDDMGLAHVRAQNGDLTFCTNLAKERNPALAGQHHLMTLGFEIAPDGNVNRFGILKDGANDAGYRDCLTEKAKAWKFPAPPSGKMEKFDYAYDAHF
jgi:hypothetical protein